MTPPRSLASLPDIVLRETLAYLLVDTPRVPHRTAVLQTCSTLHDVGLPLLYRVVDVTSASSTRLVRHLATLFGPVGLLAAGGRHPELGRSVVELRVGTTAELARGLPNVNLGMIDLPRCTRLVINHTHRPFPGFIKPLFHLLPNISDLVLTRIHTTPAEFPIRSARWEDEDDDSYPSGLANSLGLGCHRPEEQRWPNLERITYVGHVWWDPVYLPDTKKRISFGDWAFKTLVIDLSAWAPPPSTLGDARPYAIPHWRHGGAMFDVLFLEPPPRPRRVLEEVRRVELRVHEAVEAVFRKAMEQVRRDKPVDVVRERILPLIVFVGPDGKERKLIE